LEDVTAQVDGLLLRARSVAKVLDISTSKAYRMMQCGDLPTIRIGRSLRTPKTALLRWVDQNTQPGMASSS
jgi:excisionase family DNA binding protein